MKKMLVIVGMLLLLPISSHAGAGFVGANLGIDYFTGDGDSDGKSAFLYGGTAKYFFGSDEKPTVGLGASYNLATHDFGADIDFSYLTGELMYNLGNSPDGVFYLGLLYGQYKMESGGVDFDDSLWGFSVGGFTVKKMSFSYGGDIRYLLPKDADADQGIFQAMLSLGFSF